MMRGMKRATITLAALLLAGLLPLTGLCAKAQTTEAEISTRLKDKPLFLMGLWADDKLKFDAQGHPAGNYQTAPFTVCGMHVDKVSLHGSHLKLEGEREGIKFDKDGTMIRITMYVGGLLDRKMEKMSVEIDNGDSHDFGPALDAVFTEDPQQLLPLLPDFWQSYFRTHFPTRAAQVPPQSGRPDAARSGATHIGGSVTAPKLVHTAEPQFSEYARRVKMSGNVQIYLWVEEDGTPSHVRLIRPVGMGLDEKAVEAVKQYRFSPAMQNGKPVKVDLYIDVNFQIF